MKLAPQYISIGSFMEENYIFKVPKYQRCYSWEEEQVNEFINDIKKCVEYKDSKKEYNHFFGGIVLANNKTVYGTSTVKYEIIDGQQRLSTLCILNAVILERYKDIMDNENFEKKLEEVINKRIDEINKTYIKKTVEINTQLETVSKLSLSKMDQDFFNNILNINSKLKSEEKTDSHKKIENAKKIISEKIDEILDGKKLDDKIKYLKSLQESFINQCFIMTMKTETRDDAYRLFQVMNNRGLSLTEGELLRAKTLEYLDELEEMEKESKCVEDLWDNILKDKPSNILRYLTYIYQMKEGKSPKKNALYEDFLSSFFPECLSSVITNEDALRLLENLKNINRYIVIIKNLELGKWPYCEEDQNIVLYDEQKLYRLVKYLGHKSAIPVLLATTYLKQKDFKKVLEDIELFFFRYRQIENKRMDKCNKIYYEYAKIIYESKNRSELGKFKGKLKIELESSEDQGFENGIRNLNYEKSKKVIKYLLVNIEDHFNWNSSDNTKKAIDESGLFCDIDALSLEHIYPQNSLNINKKDDMEKQKHSIGNMIILSKSRNVKLGNKAFDEKKIFFKNSKLKSNEFILEKKEWNIEEIEQRKEFIIKTAKKLYSYK